MAQPDCSPRFADGPRDPAGTRVPLSERPVMCVSVFGDEAAFGISDHGLWTVSLSACDAGTSAALPDRSRQPQNQHHHSQSSVVPSSSRAAAPTVSIPAHPARRRELYTRSHGHSEWVTCVDHTVDGRVISGGMDSKLCLWASGGSVASCRDLLSHRASVSAVTCGKGGEVREEGGR
jgi:WD40 repeat protein